MPHVQSIPAFVVRLHLYDLTESNRQHEFVSFPWALLPFGLCLRDISALSSERRSMPKNGRDAFSAALPAAACVFGLSSRHLTFGTPSWASFLCRAAVSTDTDLSTEFSSDYSEFVVDLKAPYGFALAPDLLGQVCLHFKLSPLHFLSLCRSTSYPSFLIAQQKNSKLWC